MSFDVRSLLIDWPPLLYRAIKVNDEVITDAREPTLSVPFVNISCTNCPAKWSVRAVDDDFVKVPHAINGELNKTTLAIERKGQF